MTSGVLRRMCIVGAESTGTTTLAVALPDHYDTAWVAKYCSPAVEMVAASRSYGLYILTSDDIPFVQDGTRDGEAVRPRMTQRFRDKLAHRSKPWLEVGGTHERRLAAAVAAIDALDETTGGTLATTASRRAVRPDRPPGTSH